MKVALILSGLTRSASLCYDSIDKFILSKYDVDIYIHTWDVSNVSLDEKTTDSELSMDEIHKLFNPKKMVVDNYFEKRDMLVEKYSKYPKIEGTPERSMSMFYKLEQCFNLVEDKYDFLIRSRMDLMINSDIDIEKINESSINIPSNQSKQTQIVDGYAYSIPHDSHGIIDCFSIGKYDQMRKYCNVYSNLDNMCSSMGLMYHPEFILKKNLELQSVNINRFDLDFLLVRKPNR